MIKIVENKIDEVGEKRIKILSSADVELNLLKFVPVYLVRCAPKMIHVEQVLDMKLRTVTTEICHPVLEPVSFVVPSSKLQVSGLRKLFVVHRYFGSRMSECVRIGVDGWNFGRGVNAEGRRQKAELAFVRKLPAGIENGVEVCGCHLFEAEWMIPGCIAVGV